MKYEVLEEMYRTVHAPVLSPTADLENLISENSPHELLQYLNAIALTENGAFALIDNVFNSITNDTSLNESIEESDEDVTLAILTIESLIHYYRDGKDQKFNSNFEIFLSGNALTLEASQRTAQPRKQGFFSKLASGIGKAAKWLSRTALGAGKATARGAGALARGVTGNASRALGYNYHSVKTPKNYKEFDTTSDLSRISERSAATTPDILISYGVPAEDIDGLEKGTITGINLYDPNSNIVEVSYVSGRLNVRKMPSIKTDNPLPTTPKVKTPPRTPTNGIPPKPVSSVPGANTVPPKTSAPRRARAAASRSTKIPVTRKEILTAQSILNKPKFQWTASDKLRLKHIFKGRDLKNMPMPLRRAWARLPVTLRSSFDPFTDQSDRILKEFRDIGSTPIEST